MPIQFITPSIISSVANTQVTGTITASQIATVNANTITSGSIPVAQIPQLTTAKLPTGCVLQVVSVNKADSFSTTSGTFVDVTGLNVSITPISTTSRIYVVATIPLVSGTAASGANFCLTRNGTLIGQGTSGTTQNTIATVFHISNDFYSGTSFSIVDSPSTTSAITYQVRVLSSGAQTSWIGRRGSDTYAGSSSTLTAMEIAG